jgi:cytochrome c556
VKQLSQCLFAVLAFVMVVGGVTPAVVEAQDASPVVEYRKSAMNAFRIHMGGVRAATSGTAPIGHAEHHAVAFEHMATALANMFPEGTAGPGSRALPAIWTDRNDFMNKVTAIQTASAALVTASRTGDAAQIGTALQAVQATCGGCHNTYRGPAN